MITTNRDDFEERARLLRQHGMSVNDRIRHESKKVIREDHLEVGYNYRMTDIQAGVGVHQLERLDWIVEERSKIADRYLDELAGISAFRLPHKPEHVDWNWQTFSVYIHPESGLNRDDLMQALLDRGVSTRRGIMTAHRETAYKHLQLSLPNSERLEDQSIVLPLYVPMTNEEVNYVISCVKEEVARLLP